MMSAPEFPEIFNFSMDHNATDSMWSGHDFISFFPPPMDEYEMPMAENATRLTRFSLNQDHHFPQDNPGYASLPAAPFDSPMAHPQGDRPECMPLNER